MLGTPHLSYLLKFASGTHYCGVWILVSIHDSEFSHADTTLKGAVLVCDIFLWVLVFTKPFPLQDLEIIKGLLLCEVSCLLWRIIVVDDTQCYGY